MFMLGASSNRRGTTNIFQDYTSADGEGHVESSRQQQQPPGPHRCVARPCPPSPQSAPSARLTQAPHLPLLSHPRPVPPDARQCFAGETWLSKLCCWPRPPMLHPRTVLTPASTPAPALPPQLTGTCTVSGSGASLSASNWMVQVYNCGTSPCQPGKNLPTSACQGRCRRAAR